MKFAEQEVSVLAFFSGEPKPLEIKCNNAVHAMKTVKAFSRSDGFLKTVSATIKFKRFM